MSLCQFNTMSPCSQFTLKSKLHNRTILFNAIYILNSLSVFGKVAAESGCDHGPGPHLHRGHVRPVSHSQVGEKFREYILVLK